MEVAEEGHERSVEAGPVLGALHSQINTHTHTSLHFTAINAGRCSDNLVLGDVSKVLELGQQFEDHVDRDELFDDLLGVIVPPRTQHPEQLQ